MARSFDETSADISKLRFERDSAAAHHHELVDTVHRVVKAREELKDKVANTHVMLQKIYDDGSKVTMESHEMEWRDLCEHLLSLTNDF